MCGILGYSHLRRRLPSRVLTSALESLSHRGPDCERPYASKYISLGAARLRIRDLKNGDQPLMSADGNVVAIFNGEIFNYREIRSELEREGAVFDSNCDTEVVLNAFLHWDTGCFARFRGMFAIAIW